MKKIKRYEIDSFHRLCNVVNKDNVEKLAIDLAQWLVTYQHIIQQYRDKYPEQTKGKSNMQIAKGWFTWVDDGKNDMKDLSFISSETGEVKTIKPT